MIKSASLLNAIRELIEKKFDFISMLLLGVSSNPNEKKIIFSSDNKSLIYLFLKSLGSKEPNKEEKDTAKILLSIASSYLESLKERTIARSIEGLDSYLRNQKSRGQKPALSEVKGILSKEMNKAKNHLKLITNAESNKFINYGTGLKIAKLAERHKEEDPTVFFYVTIDDVTGPEEFVLHLLPDRKTPRVWKLSEVESGYHKVGDPRPKYAGLHPNCFVGNKGIKILTEKDGYKNIEKIKIGERVLTHTGKFKKVTNTLEWYNKKYYGKFIKIKYKTHGRDGMETTTLKVTPEHKFLTQRGWVKAEELTKDDCFKQLFTNCSSCGKKTYVKPKHKNKKVFDGFFCSKSCVTNYQWSFESHRNNISKKSQESQLKMWENPTVDMLERVEKMNQVTRDLISKKMFWAQKECNMETLQKNIAKVNQRLQLNRTSKEESILFDLVKSIYPTAKNQVIIEKWCVDIFIPELNVNIEYDGGGHYLPVYNKKYTMESFLQKQKGRDGYLEKCGYHILRYNQIPEIDKIKEDVERVSKNHRSEYFFDDIQIESVELVKNRKGSYKLYDITVEDDESFVVNGIVSHNCRCKIAYLAPGFGFNSNGKVTFKGIDHDEFKEQREKYGLPR